MSGWHLILGMFHFKSCFFLCAFSLFGTSTYCRSPQCRLPSFPNKQGQWRHLSMRSYRHLFTLIAVCLNLCLFSSENSSNYICFETQELSILFTWPSHLSLLSLTMPMMGNSSAHSKTSVRVIMSCHLIFIILWIQQKQKTLSLFFIPWIHCPCLQNIQ